MVQELDPRYLKETATLIKELAGPSRIVTRKLWNYWLRNVNSLAGLDLEDRKQILGHYLHEKGCVGFGNYAELPKSERH